MQIDWFTVIAQVINFLILVFLLKRFLYTPVLTAIETRKKKIEAELNSAAAKEADAAKERDKFQQKNAEIEQLRTAAMAQLADQIKTERQKQFDRINSEGAALQQKLNEALNEQRQNISVEIRNKIQEEVFATSAKVLTDLGSVSLQQQIIQSFIQHINISTANERKQLSDAFSSPPAELTITSAFLINDGQKQQLEKAIDSLSGGYSFHYQINPLLISGLEVAAGNYIIAWNIKNYLDDLKKHVQSFAPNTNKEKNVAE